MLDELPTGRPYLERLTTAELLKLADRAGIDVPPGLDRTIVIEELLEIGDAERSPFGETPGAKENPGAGSSNSPLGDPLGTGGIQVSPPLAEKSDLKPAPPDRQPATAPLPKHYNITYIEVLIRDPLWAFAFWEINDHDKETHEGAPNFDGYCLRVTPARGPDAGGLGGRESDQGPDFPAGGRAALRDGFSFTVQVGAGDSAWYLGFPPEGGRFRVELCAMRKDESVVLAVSKPFRLPILPESVEASASNNPLLRLSGIDDFTILRNTMRLSRLPKRYCTGAGLNDAGPRE